MMEQSFSPARNAYPFTNEAKTTKNKMQKHSPAAML